MEEIKCNDCERQRVHFCHEDSEFPKPIVNLDLCDIVFSIDEIEAAMNKTPDNMSSGPDGLPGILFPANTS